MKLLVETLFISCFFASLHCGSSEPPELRQATATITWQLAEYNFERSMFPAVLPNGTPRQWVSYYFSTMGSSERLPDEDHATEEDHEMARAMRMPLWPSGIAVVHTKPDPSRGKQIVLKWDDAKGIVIVEAYLNPNSGPEFVREIALPKATSVNELGRISAESQIETGGTFQSF
ncbi:MAG: hypothetical protein HYY49_11975 [Ignavibacteriales bacterium]|nr:hypothetical protein [Ignavibacteriales bacterium]